MKIALIAALGANRVIGVDGDLPWHISEDLKHFKRTTRGHTLVMGRKTFESIGKALPRRRNIVLTRQLGFEAPGCETAADLATALAMAEEAGEDVLFVGGGESVYREALPMATDLILTRVPRVVDGDTFFPEFSEDHWRLVERKQGEEVFFERWERVEK